MFVKAGNVGFPEEELLEGEWIHEGKRKKKAAQLTVVQHNTGVRYHLTISEYEKNGSNVWVKKNHIPLSEEATDKLFSYLLSRDNFANIAQTTIYTVVESIAPLDGKTVDQLAMLLRRAAKNKQIGKILSDDVVSNFSAVIHQIQYKNAIEHLKKMLEEEHKESDYNKWFLNNYWVFGTEYLSTEDVKIGWRTKGDIILTSVDGYQDIIELKLPSECILNYDNSHDSWYPSAELSQAISQAIKYIQESEDVRTTIADKEGLPFLRPRAKIVIGRSNDWSIEKTDKRMDALRKLNAQLHDIQIMTYDHLLLSAEVMIGYYSKQEKM